jgi:hypothetical protein
MPRRQRPLPAESGRAARSSRPATCLPTASRTDRRDGSGFPFGLFSGTIRLWRNESPRRFQSRCHASCPAGWKSDPIIGCAARFVAGQAASSIPSHRFHDEGELA